MMSLVLPSALEQMLAAKYGALTQIELLNGKSGANVHRLRFAQTSLVVKQTFSGAETAFYKQIAPILNSHAIPLPEVELTHHDGTSYWLVIEHIPEPLPRERWHGDQDIIHVLAQLHTIDTALIPLTPTRFIPAWDDEITHNALLCFEPALDEAITSRLKELQSRSQHLFKPECAISGDPNPANWGIRSNGALVLFDWERFTLATPAIDVAIIIGGLGSTEQFRHVAAAYLAAREAIGQPYDRSVEAFARDITLAKLWTIVEYLGLYTVGELQPDAMLEYLKQHLHDYLSSGDAMITL
jgi:aminoglycoside phosphotransferase (APT) family kinase protein